MEITLLPPAESVLHRQFIGFSRLAARRLSVRRAATLLLVYLLWMRRRNRALRPSAQKWFRITLALLMLQYVLGVADILLLAPLWSQIVHLAGADIFWIALVLLLAQTLPARQAHGIA